MAHALVEYFRAFNEGIESKELNRTGNQLARSGISDMDMLCEMLENTPEKLLGIRNIGPQSMATIQRVCTAFRRQG